MMPTTLTILLAVGLLAYALLVGLILAVIYGGAEATAPQ